MVKPCQFAAVQNNKQALTLDTPEKNTRLLLTHVLLGRFSVIFSGDLRWLRGIGGHPGAALGRGSRVLCPRFCAVRQPGVWNSAGAALVEAWVAGAVALSTMAYRWCPSCIAVAVVP